MTVASPGGTDMSPYRMLDFLLWGFCPLYLLLVVGFGVLCRRVESQQSFAFTASGMAGLSLFL